MAHPPLPLGQRPGEHGREGGREGGRERGGQGGREGGRQGRRQGGRRKKEGGGWKGVITCTCTTQFDIHECL